MSCNKIKQHFFFTGSATFVNPYVSDRTDLNQVWMEIPTGLVALGGDVHVLVRGTVGSGLKVRLAREDDDGRTLLATMPLALDSEGRMTVPCGYFSRGGIYYLELVADKDNYINAYDNSENVTNDSLSKRDVKDRNFNKRDLTFTNSVKNETLQTTVNKVRNENIDKTVYDFSNSNVFINVSMHLDGDNFVNANTEQSSVSVTHPRLNIDTNTEKFVLNDDESKLSDKGNSAKVKRDVEDEGTIMETGDSVVKSWKFDVLWPVANLDVTPEQIQTYPERQVLAIIEFQRVVCIPIQSTADFFLELLYCGHLSGGAMLCDGKNTSSLTHRLYSEEVRDMLS